MGGHAELIESHHRIRRILLNPFDISRRHLDAEGINGSGVAVMVAQVRRLAGFW